VTTSVLDVKSFIRENLPLAAVPSVPEIRLHTAHPGSGLRRLDGDTAPYWAYPWAGGTALARYVFDNPQTVLGRSVLDLGSGSGLVAIAAAKAGAAPVVAAEIDAFAVAAIELNAAANNVTIEVLTRDLLDEPASESRYDTVLVGDLFYEQTMAARLLAWLDRNLARGAAVLVGDPGRSYLPKTRLEKLADYSVPVTRDLEDNDIKQTAVWRLRPP
jgi:predicted nicotinamide N-methyase